MRSPCCLCVSLNLKKDNMELHHREDHKSWSRTLNMEAVYPFENLVLTYEITTRCYSPEDHNLL
jgi:hypothetical protein